MPGCCSRTGLGYLERQRLRVIKRDRHDDRVSYSLRVWCTLHFNRDVNAVTKMTNNPRANKLFSNAKNWGSEANLLRENLLECNLNEEIKWRSPSYTYKGKTICIVQRMTGFLSLLFFKGALLKDPDDLLKPHGPNPRVGYRIRFNSVEDVLTAAKSITNYVQEAIEIEKAGLKVELPNDFKYPEELIQEFDEDPDYRTAFNNHSPGRQRGYIMHVSDAKQSRTRTARIERCRQKNSDGKGLLER